MAEVKWQARRISDGVLVDVTGDTEGAPLGAPTANVLEAGSDTIRAVAGSEVSGDLLFEVQGETGVTLLNVDPYGSLSLRGATVEPGNGGGSLYIHGAGPSYTQKFRFLADDGSGASNATIGVAATQLGFFGATPVSQPAANPDTSGATLANLEIEVNQLKAALRALGLIAT